MILVYSVVPNGYAPFKINKENNMLQMNLSALLQKYNKIKRKGIIHVGGNIGEEIPLYKELSFQKILIFEPILSSFNSIPNESGVYKINCAVGDTEGKIMMNVSRYKESNGTIKIGESSSILTPKIHLTAYSGVEFLEKQEVDLITLDNWFRKTTLGISPTDFSCMVMDVQGYESWVVRGATNLLDNIEVIYSEVANTEIYENNTHIANLDDQLARHGFVRKEYFLDPAGSGEAIYIKEI